MKGQTLSEWERGSGGKAPSYGMKEQTLGGMGAGVWGQSPQLGDESIAFRLGEVKLG